MERKKSKFYGRLSRTVDFSIIRGIKESATCETPECNNQLESEKEKGSDQKGSKVLSSPSEKQQQQQGAKEQEAPCTEPSNKNSPEPVSETNSPSSLSCTSASPTTAALKFTKPLPPGKSRPSKNELLLQRIRSKNAANHQAANSSPRHLPLALPSAGTEEEASPGNNQHHSSDDGREGRSVSSPPPPLEILGVKGGGEERRCTLGSAFRSPPHGSRGDDNQLSHPGGTESQRGPEEDGTLKLDGGTTLTSSAVTLRLFSAVSLGTLTLSLFVPVCVSLSLCHLLRAYYPTTAVLSSLAPHA